MTYEELKDACLREILYAFGKGKDLNGATSNIIRMVRVWEEERKRNNV